MLILLSLHNWWRHPAVPLLTSHSLMSLHWHNRVCEHACMQTKINKKHNSCLHQTSKLWNITENALQHMQKQLFWQTHSVRHANLLMCSLTLTWVWLPSCASCFFHQHVFTGRGPLCLHYREAINRKASPKGLKTTVGGGNLMWCKP